MANQSICCTCTDWIVQCWWFEVGVINLLKLISVCSGQFNLMMLACCCGSHFNVWVKCLINKRENFDIYKLFCTPYNNGSEVLLQEQKKHQDLFVHWS